MTIRTVKMIDVNEFDSLVKKTYGRPYQFQQQDGCKSRGTHEFTVPSDGYDYENNTIPEEINGNEMGVSFKAWLERDPKQEFKGHKEGDYSSLDLFWSRNFYPSLDMVVDDLHSKGLLEAGSYTIDIDW